MQYVQEQYMNKGAPLHRPRSRGSDELKSEQQTKPSPGGGVGKLAEPHLMTRALPCGTLAQKVWISCVHAFFMGYWKSMFSLKRISSSNSTARQVVDRVSRLPCRQRITRAEPCSRHGNGGV